MTKYYKVTEITEVGTLTSYEEAQMAIDILKESHPRCKYEIEVIEIQIEKPHRLGRDPDLPRNSFS